MFPHDNLHVLVLNRSLLVQTQQLMLLQQPNYCFYCFLFFLLSDILRFLEVSPLAALHATSENNKWKSDALQQKACCLQPGGVECLVVTSHVRNVQKANAAFCIRNVGLCHECGVMCSGTSVCVVIS